MQPPRQSGRPIEQLRPAPRSALFPLEYTALHWPQRDPRSRPPGLPRRHSRHLPGSSLRQTNSRVLVRSGCIEHVAAVEDHYLSLILSGTAVAPRRDSRKEIRLFTTIRNRLTKVEAPCVFRPRGRFGTLAAALAEFKAVRDRGVQLVEERGDALYSIGAKHPYFGNLNGAELIH